MISTIPIILIVLAAVVVVFAAVTAVVVVHIVMVGVLIPIGVLIHLIPIVFITRKMNIVKLGAFAKRSVTNGQNISRKKYSYQRRTTVKCFIANIGYIIGKIDHIKRRTALKCRCSDACNGIGHKHTLDCGAIFKRSIIYRSYTVRKNNVHIGASTNALYNVILYHKSLRYRITNNFRITHSTNNCYFGFSISAYPILPRMLVQLFKLIFYKSKYITQITSNE